MENSDNQNNSGGSNKGLFRLLIAFNLLVIILLGSYLFTHLDKAITTANQKSGKVAGLNTSADISYPNALAITISDRKRIVESTTIELYPIVLNPNVANSANNLSTLIKSILGQSNPTPYPKPTTIVSLNKEKLNNWLIKNFSDMELSEYSSAILGFASENGDPEKLISCTPAEPEVSIPLEEIYNELTKGYPIHTEYLFQLQNKPISQEDERVNRICKEYAELKTILSKIVLPPLDKSEKSLELEFIDEKNLHAIFDFKLNGEMVYLKIRDKEKLIEKLQEIKSLSDIDPIPYEYRVNAQNFYILGTYLPGRQIDIEKTLKGLEKGIQDLDTFLEVKPIFFEDKTPLITPELSVIKYPVLLTTASTRIKPGNTQTANAIKAFSQKIDSLTLDKGETFSFNSQVKGMALPSTDLVIIPSGLKYHESLAFTATGLFRAAILAGLRIDEYSEKFGSNLIGDYMYPFGNSVVATFVISQESISDENTPIDLKFTNTGNTELFIITEIKILPDSAINLDVKIYSPENYNQKEKVRIKTRREEFTSGLKRIYKDTLERKIGNQDPEFFTTEIELASN